MKDVFKYTFLTIAEIKKFLLVVILMSILTLIQPYPVISIVSFIFEKLIYLSIGVLLVYILKITNNEEEYFATLKKQPVSTFLLHFLPNAMGIMLGIFITFTIFAAFFIIILKFTNAIYVFADPHQFTLALSKTSLITKILLGFYSIYVLIFSYVFLGKFGEALSKESFKESFLSIISSLYDFQFFVNSFNLKYMIIYFVWSIVIGVIYSIVMSAYIFFLFPLLQIHMNLYVLIIPLLIAITTILTYFTYFSAYFAYKSTKD